MGAVLIAWTCNVYLLLVFWMISSNVVVSISVGIRARNGVKLCAICLIQFKAIIQW